MTELATRTAYWLAAAAVLLSACGEDNDSDNVPNILTGLSGVIIIGLLLWWFLARRNR